MICFVTVTSVQALLADLADRRRRAEEEADLKEQRELLRRKRMKEVRMNRTYRLSASF